LFSISGCTPPCQAFVEGRPHHVEGHEEGQADQDQVCGRGLEPESGPQEGQGDHEAREAGDHDEQARRHRQHGDDDDELHDPACCRRIARRDQRLEARDLRSDRGGRQ